MARWVITVEDVDDPYRHRGVATADTPQGFWTVQYYRGDELVSDGGVSCPPPYLPPTATLKGTLLRLRKEADYWADHPPLLDSPNPRD